MLGHHAFGVTDNFFSAGGNSINLIRLNILINKAFERNDQLDILFGHPSVRDMAAYIAAGSGGPSTGLSWLQRMFFTGWKPLNDVVLTEYTLQGLDKSTFDKAVHQMVSRHEILRTRFVRSEGVVQQVILSPDEATFQPDDVIEAGSEAEIQAAMGKAQQHTFDLYDSPLFRIQSYRLSDGDYRILLVMHHIITDGYSAGILLEELKDLYLQALNGSTSGMEPLHSQYRDYVRWQDNYLRSPEGQRHQAYWLSALRGCQLPVSFYDGGKDLPSESNIRISHTLDGQLYQRMDQAIKRDHLTRPVLMMGALILLLNKLSGQRDIILTVPVTGRESASLNGLEITGLAGLFSNTLFIRNVVDREMTVMTFLQRVHAGFIKDLGAAAYPAGKLLEELGIQPDPAFLHSLVFFNYHNYPYFRKTALFAAEHSADDSEVAIPSGARLGLSVIEYPHLLRLQFEFGHPLISQRALIIQLYFSILKQVIMQPTLTIGQLSAQ